MSPEAFQQWAELEIRRLSDELMVAKRQLRDVWPRRYDDSVDAGGGVLRPVTLTNPTGSPGSDSEECGFSYDVTDTVTGELLGSNIAMDGHGKRDPLGTMSAGTVGWAFLMSGECLLRYADEQNSVTSCNNSADGGSA